MITVIFQGTVRKAIEKEINKHHIKVMKSYGKPARRSFDILQENGSTFVKPTDRLRKRRRILVKDKTIEAIAELMNVGYQMAFECYILADELVNKYQSEDRIMHTKNIILDKIKLQEFRKNRRKVTFVNN